MEAEKFCTEVKESIKELKFKVKMIEELSLSHSYNSTLFSDKNPKEILEEVKTFQNGCLISLDSITAKFSSFKGP